MKQPTTGQDRGVDEERSKGADCSIEGQPPRDDRAVPGDPAMGFISSGGEGGPQ